MNKPSNEHEAMTEESLALQRMNAAEDFPRNTCPASRIAAGLAEAMITGRPYPLLTEERAYCGAMLAATVAALWEARTEMARKGGKPVDNLAGHDPRNSGGLADSGG